MFVIDRIVDDLGSAFSMGCVGGSVWHFFKGMRHSPKGYRLSGGYSAVTLRAPVVGSNFAVWGGLFAVFDCSITHLRGKEDPINAIASGAATGGLLAARSGAKAIGRNALIGGALLAMIEGLSYLLTSKFQQQPQQPVPQFVSPVQGPGGIMIPGVNASPAGSAVSRAARGAGVGDHEEEMVLDAGHSSDDFAPSHAFDFDLSEDFADEL